MKNSPGDRATEEVLGPLWGRGCLHNGKWLAIISERRWCLVRMTFTFHIGDFTVSIVIRRTHEKTRHSHK